MGGNNNLCLNRFQLPPLNPDLSKNLGWGGMMEGAGQRVAGVRERALSNVFKTPKQACDDVMEWRKTKMVPHFDSHSKHLTPWHNQASPQHFPPHYSALVTVLIHCLQARQISSAGVNLEFCFFLFEIWHFSKKKFRRWIMELISV